MQNYFFWISFKFKFDCFPGLATEVYHKFEVVYHKFEVTYVQILVWKEKERNAHER